MKRNPKKGPFDLSVDLMQIPSFRSRFASMDSLTGSPIKMDAPCETNPIANPEPDLRERLRSGTDIRSTPSIILRRKGVRV